MPNDCTVFIGVQVREEDGKRVKEEPFLADLFYNGKNADVDAKMHVRLSQIASKEISERPGSLLMVWGNVGGASGLLLSILGLVRTILAVCFQI